MVFSDEDNILIKKFVFQGAHSKEVDRLNFLRKAGQSVVYISCLKSCGTQAQLISGQAAADRAVERK